MSLRNFDVVVEPDNLIRRKRNPSFRSVSSNTFIPIKEKETKDITFFSLSSSTVGRKLSFRSRYRFFSSFCFFSSAGLCSANRFIPYIVFYTPTFYRALEKIENFQNIGPGKSYRIAQNVYTKNVHIFDFEQGEKRSFLRRINVGELTFQNVSFLQFLLGRSHAQPPETRAPREISSTL